VWDPCFAGEVAVILEHGMRRILQDEHDEFHYLLLMNENYAHPSVPASAHADLLAGMWCVKPARHAPQLRLLGSGAILREVLQAAATLQAEHALDVEVWSVTSYSELQRNAIERAAASHVVRCLPGDVPVIAASDYVRAWPQLIAPHLEAPMHVLGTDGFGRSDSRRVLRRFFGVDASEIVKTAVAALQRTRR
jgi:pyruvate dehydrogenase E1 component